MEKVPTIVCLNDSADVHTSCRRVQAILNSQGHNIQFLSFETAEDFSLYLESCSSQNLPSAYIFDSSPFFEGDISVSNMIERFQSDFSDGSHYPLICFTSGNMDVALQASAKLWRKFPSAHVYLTDIYADEEGSPVFWRAFFTEDRSSVTTYPRTYGLRKLVNHLLGLALPLTTMPSNLGRDFEALSLRKEKDIPLNELVRRNFERKETLFSLTKPVVEEYARELRNGAADSSDAAELVLSGGQILGFNGAVGRAVSGPVIFNPDQISEMSSPPVLVVERWPANVLKPHFNSLAGIVVLSPHLADHLRIILKTSGLCSVFGLSSRSSKGSNKTPAFITDDSIEVEEGKTLHKGNWVSLKLGSPQNEEARRLSKAEKDDLDLLQITLRDYLRSLRCSLPIISTTWGEIPFGEEKEKIGLLRTEQMASESPEQIQLCAALLKGKTEESSEQLGKLLREDYKKVYVHGLMYSHLTARIRLFDFRISDHFPEELKEELPLSLVRGGEALRSYSELYKVQIASVFAALHDFYAETELDDSQIEIIMPSLSTPEDTDLFIAEVSTAAEAFGFNRGTHYTIGVMAETKGFCENVSQIAPKVDAISIGSNDLTSDVLGIGRGDTMARHQYCTKHGFDPFVSPAPQVFDRVIPDLIEAARKANSDIHLCLCGEHAENPKIIGNLTRLGVDEFSVATGEHNIYILPLLALHDVYENRIAFRPVQISMTPK